MGTCLFLEGWVAPLVHACYSPVLSSVAAPPWAGAPPSAGLNAKQSRFLIHLAGFILIRKIRSKGGLSLPLLSDRAM